MKKTSTIGRRALLGSMLALPAFPGLARAQAAVAKIPAFRRLAPTPPMGWNSWDSFATTITEEQARANAAVMADKLKPHGYTIFTVDIQWYEPNATGFDYRDGAHVEMDTFARLQPAVNRFPSAASGAGFKPLSNHIHSLGLKFGIHLMRGIPRQAVTEKLPIMGAPGITAADIANVNSTCPWNKDMYGVDMTKPGAQAYYDSVFRLIADWGVDFIKVDDLSRPYHQPEIEAIRKAIDKCGRPMILSTSPGDTPLSAAPHVVNHANMWRISDDFWDNWRSLKAQFARLENWNPHRVQGAWPDADMLPLGKLSMGKRNSGFKPDEQQTLMTLWSIARSPLIMGGDLRYLDDATEALLTNDEVLAVNQKSTGNKPLFNKDGMVAWTAKPEGSRDTYLAVFNINDVAGDITVDLSTLGLTRTVSVRNLWTHKAAGTAKGTLRVNLRPHASELYRLS